MRANIVIKYFSHHFIKASRYASYLKDKLEVNLLASKNYCLHTCILNNDDRIRYCPTYSTYAEVVMPMVEAVHSFALISKSSEIVKIGRNKKWNIRLH